MTLPQQYRWLVETPIAHRGLHGPGVPENSLAAFRAAAQNGLAIEMDAQLLADGAVAVFHDGDLKRLTSREGRLARQTAQSIQSYRLLGTEQSIPLLAEVMESIKGATPLLIEVKNETLRIGPLESAVGTMLSGYHGPAAVMSFNPLSVGYFRRHFPQIPRGQLSGLFGGGIPKFMKLWLASMPLNWWTRPDFVACDIELLGDQTQSLRDSGMPVLAWTVTTPNQRERARRLADNIIFELRGNGQPISC